MALDFIGGLFGGTTEQKFLLRDFRNAAQLTPGVNPPRQKFEGYVNFILNRDLYAFLYEEGDKHDFRKEISSLIRTADLPSVTFQTETKNAYNKKKIINTGVTYDAVSMTVFDTVGNEWLTTLMKYFSYHFMDPRNLTQGDRDIGGNLGRAGGDELYKFNSNAAGYNLNASSQFFERIDYVLYHGRKGVQYSIINPVMKSFKPGTIDYSSSDFQEFTLDFDYEKFTVYDKLNFSLEAEDLSRFESITQIKGDLFTDEDLPEVMKERQLSILGSAENSRERSLQPNIETATETTEEETTENNDAEGEVTETTPTPSTYAGGSLTDRSAGAEESGGFLKDLLGDVADSALSAVLRGQNVRDAVIGTAVAGASTALGEAIANSDVSEDDQIVSGDN
tara:strand:+ start:12609 stop:13787 length:1179 start_codon:yes stop_codon:yes gene_type:complete